MCTEKLREQLRKLQQAQKALKETIIAMPRDEHKRYLQKGIEEIEIRILEMAKRI